MDISWDDARLFLAVAETGSFSAAARRTKLGQPTISRRIALLEEQLGGQLFNRTAEGATATALGERLVPVAAQMHRWAAEWQRLAAGAEEGPTGLVRIAAPPGVAWDFVVPFARDVRRRWPSLRIEALASVEHLDLSRGEADMALRSRPPRSKDLTVLHTLTIHLGVFVARSYRRELPAQPQAQDMRWICPGGVYEHLPPRPELAALIPDFRPAFSSDNYLVQQQAALAGLGAMILPRAFVRAPPLCELVEVPTSLPLPTETGYLVVAKSALHIPRVRVVSDMLVEALDQLARSSATHTGAES